MTEEKISPASKEIAKKINDAIKQGVPISKVFKPGEQFDFWEDFGVGGNKTSNLFMACSKKSRFPVMQVYEIMTPKNKASLFSLLRGFSLYEDGAAVWQQHVGSVSFSFLQKVLEDIDQQVLKREDFVISHAQQVDSLSDIFSHQHSPRRHTHIFQVIENLRVLSPYADTGSMLEDYFFNSIQKTGRSFFISLKNALSLGEPVLSAFTRAMSQKPLQFFHGEGNKSIYCTLFCDHLLEGKNLEQITTLANILGERGLIFNNLFSNLESIFLSRIFQSGTKNLKPALEAASQIDYFKGFKSFKQFVCDANFDNQLLLNDQSLINKTHLSFFDKVLNKFSFGELLSWRKNINQFSKGLCRGNLLSLLSRDLGKINEIREAYGVPKIRAPKKNWSFQEKKEMIDSWEEIKTTLEGHHRKHDAEIVQSFIFFLEKDLLLSSSPNKENRPKQPLKI